MSLCIDEIGTFTANDVSKLLEDSNHSYNDWANNMMKEMNTALGLKGPTAYTSRGVMSPQEAYDYHMRIINDSQSLDDRNNTHMNGYQINRMLDQIREKLGVPENQSILEFLDEPKKVTGVDIQKVCGNPAVKITSLHDGGSKIYHDIKLTPNGDIVGEDETTSPWLDTLMKPLTHIVFNIKVTGDETNEKTPKYIAPRPLKPWNGPKNVIKND